MKKLAKKIIVAILGWQVRRLQRSNSWHSFNVVAVAGSTGKTSTKFAIAKVLEQSFRVRWQKGNYNDIVTVPLIFFGQEEPSLLNPFAWAYTIFKNELQLHKKYPYDFVVIELGTDKPGDIPGFDKYLRRVDLTVITAVAPEHMEFFKDLDAVAKEELSVDLYSDETLINEDLVDSDYLKYGSRPCETYTILPDTKKQKESSKQTFSRYTYGHPDYRLTDLDFSEDGYNFRLLHLGKELLVAKHESIAETQLYSITAAAAVGHKFGMSKEKILSGIESIKPVSGRMQRLNGINNSQIIDDTYNASPTATKAALDTLYRLEAPQKIAVLGNMNELGDYSESAHKEIGEYCDPKQLELVVTIGPDANKFLADAAKAKGCNVKTFDSPYEAGKFVKTVIKPGAIVLAKGSQNGVFAEETVKLLLADSNDVDKLVRQTAYWLKIKQATWPQQSRN